MKKEALTTPALEALLQAPSLAILAVDKQGCMILWSPSASRMFGWTESEVLGRFLPIVPEEHRQGVYDRIQGGLKGGIISALDVRRLRKDGSLVDVSLWTAPLRNSKDEVIGILGLYADITARKRAEGALQQTEAELRRVLAAVSDYLYSGEFDSNGRFFYHYYSPAVERILGRPPLFFLAGPERWLSAVHPEDRPRLAQAFARLQTGRSASEEEEYRIVLPDGAIRWVRDSVIMTQGTDGRRFVNGVVSDITARKQSEEALRESELELRRVLGAASDYFWSGDIDSERRFRYRYYSPAVERITGRPAEFYMAGSERWLSTVHPEDRARLSEISERLLSGQSVSCEYEYRIVLSDGTIRWLRANTTVSPSADGHRRVDGVVGDITARKQSEEALRESELELRQVLGAASDYFWSGDIDPEGGFHYRYYSPAVERITGRPAEFYIAGSERWLSTIHPEDRPRLAEISARMLSGQLVSSENEHRIVLPDGTIRWVRANVTVSPSIDGYRRLDGVVSDITARKQAEEALRESEARFRGIFTAAASGIVLVSPEGRFLHANPAFCEFLGYSEQELLSKRVQDVTHPDDRERTAEVRRQIWKGEKPLIRSHEKRYLRKDGQTVWSEISISLIRDAMGNANYSITQVLDITERKRAETAARESEERLRALIEHSFDVVTVLKADGIIQFTSASTPRVLGYQTHEWIGRNAFELVHPEDLPRATEVLNQLLKTPGGTMMEQFRCRHKDGSWRWVEASGTNCLAQPAVGGIILNYRDITERKQADEVLRASEERYRTLAESATDAIFIIDRDDRIQYLNSYAASMMGSTPKELTGKRRVELFPPDTSEHQRREIEVVFESGRPRHIQNTTRFTGGELWLDTQLIPLRNAGGEVRAVMGISRDITAQKRIEEALRQSEANLGRAQSLAHLGNWSWDIQKDQLSWSDEMYRIYGVNRETFGHNLSAFVPLIHPQDMPRQMEAIKAAEAGRTFEPFEVRVVHPDGSLRVVQLLGTEVERDASGRPKRIFGTSLDITERKRAENALRESEERYRLMAEAIPQPAWRTNAQGETTECNGRWYEYTGQTPEEARGNGWMKALHPDDTGCVMQKVKSDVASGDIYQVEYRLRRASDGSYRWHIARALPIKDKDGRIVCWFGSAADIDDQKRAQEMLEERVQKRTAELAQSNMALRNSEAKYRTLVEELPAITYVAALDEANTTLYVSPQVESVLGLTPADYSANPDAWRRHVHPDDLDLVIAEVRHTHMGGQPLDCEYRLLNRTGGIVWIRDKAVVVRNEAGQPLFLQGVILDVTERHQAEETMRLQSTALQAADNGIVITDHVGDIVWANPAFTKLTGYKLSEVIGKDLRVLRSGQHTEAFYRNLWQTPLSGRVWHGEIINKRKDGSLYTEEETITPVRDARGEISHFIAIKQDITEWKLAEEARARLAAIVEYSDEAIVSSKLDGTLTSWNAGAQRLYNYAAEEMLGRRISVLIPRNRRGEAEEFRKKALCGEHIQHFETVRLKKGGIPVDVAVSVSPLKNAAGKTIGVSAITSDITERKELERAIVEASSREQRRIGQDLHDGLCQQLTGIGFLWEGIAQRAAVRALLKTSEVAEISQLIVKTIGEARDLARVLYPVELEGNDLGVALKNLGLSMERLSAISCVVRCQQPVALADKTVATHLYRIAQEAISNAIHQGKAARVWIHLVRKKNKLTLRIRDNGSGFSKRRGFKEGIGMRSMKYRAQVIGGSLTIESKRGTGTTVACVCTRPRSRFAGEGHRHTRG